MTENEPGASESELYEFDAPSHVVDFMELVNAETDDRWFDERASGEDGNLVTPLKLDPTQDKGARAAAVPPAAPDCSSGQKTPPPQNIVKSWGADTRKATRARTAVTEHPAQPSRVLKRKRMTSTQTAPPVKKSKETPVAQKDGGTQLGCRSSARLNAPAANASHGAVPPTAKKELVSSEELEMERIKTLQREVALHRMQNEASYKAALAGNPPPKKAVLSTTVPKDFHFSTDGRVKAPTSSQSSRTEVDFVHQLRKPASPAKARRGATMPKPFNLSAGNKRKEEESAAYVPMAQQIKQFERKTPVRYHRQSRRIQEKVKASHPKLTQPHSPHLMTRQRSRPTSVKSSADLEAEEMERQKKFKIKALELNKKILEGPEELRKPPVKEPTVPEGFELELERRLQQRQATKKSEDEEKLHNFKANPLPKKVLDGVVGLPEKKVLLPTVPESPAFALKKRIRVERKAEEVKQPSPVKAPPVPHFGLPFQPRLPQDHHLDVCPFSFEERERERRALKERKLEEMRNQEVPQFKAQPLPDFDTVVLPEKKKCEPTKPEPFKLQIDERGAVKSSRWEQMVKEEQKHQEEAAAFKARPNTVIHKEPFRPKKESRPTLDVHSSSVAESFELATERRAKEWQEYERTVSEKEALRARMEVEQRREEEQRIKAEIAMLRQEQVHKAQPIRQYKPVTVKKSEIPLTVPESPNFSDRFRL